MFCWCQCVMLNKIWLYLPVNRETFSVFLLQNLIHLLFIFIAWRDAIGTAAEFCCMMQLTYKVSIICYIPSVKVLSFVKAPDVIVPLFLTEALYRHIILLISLSSRTLSCWFLRSPPLPTAECASCSLSRVAPKTSTVCGGQRWKEAAFMLKSLRELCPRAAKTGQSTQTLLVNVRKNKLLTVSV